MKKITITEIANRSNLSIATVSRVFKRPELVRNSTKNKVMKIANQLGYHTCNHIYMAPQINSAKKLLILYKNNEINQQIICSIKNEMKKTNYSICSIEITEKFDPNWLITMLRTTLNYLAGIIILNKTHQLEEIIAHYLPKNFPLIIANDFSLIYPFVHFDYISSAFKATSFLKNQGHRHIAYILDQNNYSENLKIKHGHEQAILRKNAIFKNEHFIECENTIESGILACEYLLNLPIKPSAICCYNDIFLHATLHFLTKKNISIPHKISLLSLNDSIFSQFNPLSITAIQKPFDLMSEKIMQLLLQQTEHTQNQVNSELLETRLIIRQSTMN